MHTAGVGHGTATMPKYTQVLSSTFCFPTDSICL